MVSIPPGVAAAAVMVAARARAKRDLSCILFYGGGGGLEKGSRLLFGIMATLFLELTCFFGTLVIFYVDLPFKSMWHFCWEVQGEGERGCYLHSYSGVIHR